MLKKIKKIILDPNWGFDFKISIDKHIVNLEQGKQISIKVRLESARGTSQDVPLRVNMQWESVGLTTKISPSSLNPMEQWEATMMIRASATTPPGSYLYTVEGSTNGTFKVSEDAVMVNVYPKDKKKEDNENEPEDQEDFQTGQPNNPASPSFSLDNLFAPSPNLSSDKPASIPTGNAAWDRLTPDERKKIEQQTKSGSVIGVVLGLIILGVIASVVMSKIDWKSTGTSSGSSCPSLNCGGHEPGGVTVVGGTVPTNCSCPASCPYTYKSGLPGFKQCSTLRPK